MKQINEHFADVNVDANGLGTIVARADETPTASVIAEHMNIPVWKIKWPVFDFLRNKNTVWKGKVNTVYLTPGGTIDVIWKKKFYSYKPEQHDENPNGVKGLTTELVGAMYGTLCHDASAYDKVGYTSPALNCERYVSFEVVVNDGEGTKLRQYNITNTNTGFSEAAITGLEVGVIGNDAEN